jgi:hypothetical protein
MKTISSPFRTVSLITVIALAGAATLAMVEASRAPATPIEKLERVVIVGKRAGADEQQARVQLPRVVVIGHRADNATQVAQASVPAHIV